MVFAVSLYEKIKKYKLQILHISAKMVDIWIIFLTAAELENGKTCSECEIWHQPARLFQKHYFIRVIYNDR